MTDLSFLTLDSWVTSDSHWSHNNIRKYQNRPEDHFQLMARRWRELVQPDDVILHLGDIVCYGDQDLHPRWLIGLPGHKYLLRGNHDKHKDIWYESFGFKVLGRNPVWWYPKNYDYGICFSHEPETHAMNWDINVHGHVHLNAYHPNIGRLEDRRNVCVELTNFEPIRLREVLG